MGFISIARPYLDWVPILLVCGFISIERPYLDWVHIFWQHGTRQRRKVGHIVPTNSYKNAIAIYIHRIWKGGTVVSTNPSIALYNHKIQVIWICPSNFTICPTKNSKCWRGKALISLLGSLNPSPLLYFSYLSLSKVTKPTEATRSTMATVGDLQLHDTTAAWSLQMCIIYNF